MGIEVVNLSLIDVRGSRDAITPEVGAVVGGPDWWDVDEFGTRESSGRIKGVEFDIIGFQDGGGNVGDSLVIVVMKSHSLVRRGRMLADQSRMMKFGSGRGTGYVGRPRLLCRVFQFFTIYGSAVPVVTSLGLGASVKGVD